MYDSNYRCNYFWYLLRCFNYLVSQNKASIETIPGKIVESPFSTVIWFNDKPFIFDFRDDSHLHTQLSDMFPESIIFKSNYSTELWDKTPSTFEYQFNEEDHKYRKNIKPFVYGRAFNFSNKINEINYAEKNIVPMSKNVVSFTGSGIFAQQTNARFKIYDLIENNIKNNELCFYDREHYKHDVTNYENLKAKYDKKNSNLRYNYQEYLKFLSSGKYSLNVPGIAMSQPFRLIDSVLVKRVCISTKIWTDVYKDFPCIQLPVCGYTGVGDWEESSKILQKLDTFDYNSLTNDSMLWYTKYISAEGMWKNQIERFL